MGNYKLLFYYRCVTLINSTSNDKDPTLGNNQYYVLLRRAEAADSRRNSTKNTREARVLDTLLRVFLDSIN